MSTQEASAEQDNDENSAESSPSLKEAEEHQRSSSEWLEAGDSISEPIGKDYLDVAVAAEQTGVFDQFDYSLDNLDEISGGRGI